MVKSIERLRKLVKLKLRIYIANEKDESFMGIGVLWLLKGIEEYGSIRRAAAEMDMSYTKAFNILKRLEKSLGEAILERHKGGNSREGATITEFGRKFLDQYEEFNKKIEDYSNSQLNDFLKNINET